MEVSNAVQTAKENVASLFENDGLVKVTLEEVEFDDIDGVWNITLGLFRQLSFPTKNALLALTNPEYEKSYKIVRVSDGDGKFLSVKNRDLK